MHDHPRVGLLLHLLATVVKNQGRSDEAKALYEEALRINVAALGDMHPDIAQTHNNLAIVFHGEGDLQTALEHFEKAAEIDSAVVGADHPRNINAYANIALTHSALGHLDEARDFLERADVIATEHLPAGNETRERTRMSLAKLRFDQGDLRVGLQMYRESLQSLEASSPESPAVPRAHQTLGNMLCETGRPDQALVELRRAAAKLERLQVDPDEMQRLRDEIAECGREKKRGS